MQTAIVVLAAGQGSRMRSSRPKVLHEVGGLPLLRHALRSAAALNPARRIVVTGHGGEAVAAAARAEGRDIECITQTEQNGTGHAVAQARAALADFDGDLVVLYGDTPFITGTTLERLAAARTGGADMAVLGFEAADPTGYGRLITGPEGLERIVEERDASQAERAVRLCNSGVMAAPAGLLFDLIGGVGTDNAKGEQYLTDIIALGRARGLSAAVVACPEAETLGINTRADLAAAEAVFQAGARRAALAAGATLTAPETVFFAHDTTLAEDVTVAPFVTFGPGVSVGRGAEIRSFSHLEGAQVAAGAQIGPYARLRPGAEIGAGARIGNFVEVKAAEIGAGAKVNHLSYVGDAGIGEGANLGAGTITCNYDGVFKHRTQIGADAFIGSNSALVAPVTVAEGGYVASGSTVTRDVGPGDLAFGRARQENKPGLGARLMKKLRQAKAAGRG
ncbi:MAG: bifunctional UDP-N-acetylglucosamine diphosphorylase/glucosamine-1-phosphate N-acetyltransferase GlmU [Pseudomonadota bacterium]